MFQIDIPIQPGNSGGPMLNKEGEVVGVITSTLNQIITLRESGSLPQNVNFAVKSDYILTLVNNIDTNVRDISNTSFVEIIEDAEQSVYLIITK